MDKNKIVSDLNTLLTRNYDAEKGYHNAADDVKDVDLKRLFEVYSDQRYHFGHDIKGEIKKLGGELDKGDSVKAKAHRTWMDLKTAISSDKKEAVLEECITGEEKALKDYRETISSHPEMPETTKVVLDDHIKKIEESLYQIRELEDQY